MSDTTAIDILLEPDAAMLQHAQAANARLLKAFPKGFALDAAHQPRISFSPSGVSLYQLGNYGVAAKKLKGWTLGVQPGE